MLDLLTKNIQGREALHCLVYSLEHSFFLDGKGAVTLSMVIRTFTIRNMVFDVSHSLLSVALLAFLCNIMPW